MGPHSAAVYKRKVYIENGTLYACRSFMICGLLVRYCEHFRVQAAGKSEQTYT